MLKNLGIGIESEEEAAEIRGKQDDFLMIWSGLPVLDMCVCELWACHLVNVNSCLFRPRCGREALLK